MNRIERIRYSHAFMQRCQVSAGLASTMDIFFPHLITIGDNTIIGYNTVILAHEFLVHHLDDLLPGPDPAQHLLAGRPRLDRFHQVAGHLEHVALVDSLADGVDRGLEGVFLHLVRVFH